MTTGPIPLAELTRDGEPGNAKRRQAIDITQRFNGIVSPNVARFCQDIFHPVTMGVR